MCGGGGGGGINRWLVDSPHKRARCAESLSMPCHHHHVKGSPRTYTPLQWRHNGCESVPNQQPHDCLLKCLFRRKSKKTSKPRVTGLCEGNSTVTGEFLAQMASNVDNVSIWWRHHACCRKLILPPNTFLWIYNYRADLHDDKWLKMGVVVVVKIVHTCLKIRNTCDFLSVIFAIIKGFQITYLSVLKYGIFMTFVSVIYTIIKISNYFFAFRRVKEANT